jgi:hypothetical protein
LRLHLRRVLLGSVELAGWALERLSRRLPMRGAGTDDFQDIELWRKSAVAGARLVRAVARGPVIVPMAFSCRDYFDEVVAGMSVLDSTVRVFCLRAGMPTILERRTPLNHRRTSLQRDGWRRTDLDSSGQEGRRPALRLCCRGTRDPAHPPSYHPRC